MLTQVTSDALKAPILSTACVGETHVLTQECVGQHEPGSVLKPAEPVARCSARLTQGLYGGPGHLRITPAHL